MRVLIIGYACNPYGGSENSHTWNWAWHLSRLHDVCVLAYPSDRPNVEALLAECPKASIRVHWLATPRFPKYAQRSNVALALHHLLWLRAAYIKAVELHNRISFDLVHHVSYGAISAPPPSWRLPVPFVWGPIGGAQRWPSAFRHHFIGTRRAGEVARDFRIALVKTSPSFRRTVQSTALALTTNQETYRLLTEARARNVKLFLDSGIPSSFISSPKVPKERNGTFTLLWVGRMQPRKALPLALEAVAQADDVPLRLLVAGDGEMRAEWESCARRLSLGGRVQFLGQVPWGEMSHLYQTADAFLFTSLRDSFGTQVLEAMAHRLPILTFDHQGVGTFVPSDAGIKVPVTTPRQTVAELADGIRRLVSSPEERLKMGEAAYAFARTETWERRAERMSELYEEVVGCRPSRGKGSLPSETADLSLPVTSSRNAKSFRCSTYEKTEEEIC
jgi:glycosyltransferase involved in cell wall biosynthesis